MDKLKLAVKKPLTNRYRWGVSANSGIRKAIKDAEQKYGWKTYVPKFEYTTDNAAMIELWVIKILSQQFETAAVVSKARIKF
jgi:N6-L-threonylcarbamoyladenine synthase